MDGTDAVAGAPGFAAFMEWCLHDPAQGYYATGAVALGRDGHFDTWPERLPAAMGRMVAEAAREALEALDRAGHLPAEGPLTLLELGAGRGTLAKAVLDALAASRDAPRWRPWAHRLRLVVGEHSPALRALQATTLAAHLEAGRAELRAIDARTLTWEGPFHGVVIANELLDTFPVERLRLDAPRAPLCRVHMAEGAQGWEEVDLPLALGWLDPDGRPGALPPDLSDHLDAVRPLLQDLAAQALLPAEVLWAPGMAPFVDGLAALLQGPDRAGVALLVDYGGTSRHVLDPLSRDVHLRAFGPDRRARPAWHTWHAPGRFDLTWDVDWTHVGRLATAAGLGVLVHDHQGALVRAVPEAERARLEPRDLLGRFQHAAGFRLFGLGPPDVHLPTLGPPRPWDGPALDTLHPDALRALATLPPPAPTDALHVGGEPLADLWDDGQAGAWEAAERALRSRDWLTPPGTLPWRTADRWALAVRAQVPEPLRSVLAEALARPATLDELEAHVRPAVDAATWAAVDAWIAAAVECGDLIPARRA
ncbi:MAG: SAM-dependent methyltransferase [Alphaproteobacteria bacterium]|nr:SAM-dependent methyltransferase [Alphaproteobacteria bacterium]